MDNSVGINCGSGGPGGWRGAKGENWDNYNRITIKNLKQNLHKEKEVGKCSCFHLPAREIVPCLRF